MSKILTIDDLPEIQERNSRYNEGTNVCVTCSQSHRGGTRLRSNMCELDVDRNSRDTSGFPLKVTVRVNRLSSKLISSCYIVDHKAEYSFWIPHDNIISDHDGFDIISKIIFLMNVPFSLDTETLISKVLALARCAKDSVSNNKDGYMALDITKTTRLPETEFMEMYNNMDENYNFESWERAQKELDSRIQKFELVQKEVGMKKMRYEDCSNLWDICSICMEEFSTGSIVSCIHQCSHVYHEVCILEWLFENRSCPYCRCQLRRE
ncbi:hypothetical protein HAX54_032981 [Datura stramonium]|uniref:RING-type E3 ubiquitin transferase n=1 Tax=Datura stramonium TaxID=4076 RepID=A0ABS8SCX6_DATST|nr:hypothetical protein [Datura stramonium]